MVRVLQVWKQLNYYDKAMFVSFLLQSILFFITLGLDPSSVFSQNWLINFLSVPQFFCGPLAGAGYVGRFVDASLPEGRVGWWEKWGMILGVLAGIGLGVTLSVLLDVIPLFATLSYVAYGFLMLSTVNTFAGIGSRVGQFFDPNGRAVSEKRSMLFFTVVGLCAGVALFLTKCVSVFAIAGVLTVASGSAALPIVLAGVMFTARFSAVIASASDHCSKAVNYFRQESLAPESDKVTIKSRKHEYLGAARGVGVGLLVGGAVIAGLLLMSSPVFVGVSGAIAAAMILVTSVSIWGKLFSTYGRYCDAENRLIVDQVGVVDSNKAVQSRQEADPLQQIVLVPEVVIAPTATSATSTQRFFSCAPDVVDSSVSPVPQLAPGIK